MCSASVQHVDGYGGDVTGGLAGAHVNARRPTAVAGRRASSRLGIGGQELLSLGTFSPTGIAGGGALTVLPTRVSVSDG
jgi:hypothetical protein